MLSTMHLPLMNVDWESSTKELITLLNLVVMSFEMILYEEFMKLIGR